MASIDREFLFEYDKANAACAELLPGTGCVKDYYYQMDMVSDFEKRYISDWSETYSSLKHCEWVYFQITCHGKSYVASRSDIRALENFCKLVIEQNDPLTVLNGNADGTKKTKYIKKKSDPNERFRDAAGAFKFVIGAMSVFAVYYFLTR